MKLRQIAKALTVLFLLALAVLAGIVTATQPTYKIEEVARPVVQEQRAARKYEWPPLYYQFDERWASHPYANGTIEEYGCGLTAFASALSYKSQSEITPDMLAEVVGDSCLTAGVNDIGKFLAFFRDDYGLVYSDIFYLHEQALQRLHEGYIIFAGVEGTVGNASYGGHIVLLWEVYGHINMLDPASDTNGGLTEEEFNAADFTYFYWLKVPAFG